MDKKAIENNKSKISIDSIAEKWAKIILAQIDFNRQSERNNSITQRKRILVKAV